MNVTSITVAGLAIVERPACQRCGHRDRRGLVSRLGLDLCGVCILIAKGRCHA